MVKLKFCAVLLALVFSACVGDLAPPADISERPTALVGTPKTWRPLTNPAPFSANAPVLANDGTVLVQAIESSQWWRLTPSATGSYVDGTWTQLPSGPSGYGPLYFAAAILPDGRFIVEGGEYNVSGPAVRTTRGAIYSPTKDSWTSVTPPAGWATIGDASSMVLADGRFLLSDCCTDMLAILDPVSMTWTQVGSDKQDSNNEESWALLPDDTILTIDANNPGKPTESEILDPSTMRWTSGGSTIVTISDTNPDNSGSHEQGPLMLLPSGVVLAIGGTGNTASYDTSTKTWKAGPNVPSVGGALTSADGAGAVLPNGKALIAVSPGVFQQGTHFFEFDGTTYVEVGAMANSATTSSYQYTFLVLPTGEIMGTDQFEIEIYTPSAGVYPNSGPAVTSAPRPVTADDPDPIEPEKESKALALTTLHPGQTYKVTGTQLAGLTQGAYYGDDAQAFTNYPMVRVTYQNSPNVKYFVSHHLSSYSVRPGTVATTLFDVPADAAPGLASLQLVANGVASPPVLVNIK